ncbi:MAG TPA: class I SAM-dependent methyltransferase [Candidatus Methylacidiphilales bacterium]
MPTSTDYSAVKDDLVHQQPEAISAMFGRVAARYDLMNHVMGGGLDLYWRWLLVRAVRKQQPARILDLATGSGDVLLALKKQRAYTETAVGADFCLPMLQQARAKKATNLLVGDGLHLPFPAASFDAVTIAWGLRNFSDRLAGLKEMRRVLRPGGRLYVLEFSHPVAWLAPLYFGYMRDVMPKYAQFITPERGAYEYLGESIRTFPTQPRLVEMMREAGFSTASWKNLSLGIVAIHTANV